MQRARYLFKLKALFDEHREEVAAVCTSEHGKTLGESRNDFGRGIENVEHAAGIPTLLMGQSLSDVATGIDSRTIRQPLGVFAAITPFNFPPMVPLWFLPYAIAAGNTFVLKPSEQVPLSQQRIFELIQKVDLPPGVVNLVHGGKDVVNAFCAHKQIRGVSFVGSSAVARHVYRSCAETGKRVQALGGAKNFVAIMPDADLDKAIANAADSAYGCAGQRCLAASVVVAVGGAYERVREGLLAAAKAVVLGDGSKPGVTMGPVISAAHRDRVVSYIDRGVAEGAKLALDGRGARVAGYPGGFWVGPTVFDDVRPGMAIATEEIFGPVLCIVRAKDLDEAIAIANRASTATPRPSTRRAARPRARSSSASRRAWWGSTSGSRPRWRCSPSAGRRELLRRHQGPRGHGRRLLHRAQDRDHEVVLMARIVKGGLIQCSNPVNDPGASVAEVRDAMLEKHLPVHRRGGQEGRADPLPARGLQRPVLLPLAGRALVRHRRGRPRPHGRAPRRVREEVPDGDGRPGVRAGDRRCLLQHRRRHRRRRDLPRQVPQEPHPPDQRLLGEVLLQARQPRLPDLPDPVRPDRRLHLLRPPLPRGRAPARPARRRDRLQPLGHGRRPLAVPVEARAARPRRRQRLLHRRVEPRRHRGAVEHRQVLRLELLLRPARQFPRRRAARTRTSWSSPR